MSPASAGFLFISMKANMSEPISGAAAGAAGWKLIGGAAGAAGIGATLASIVVMLRTRPKTDAEWTIAIISTLVGSIAGGAYMILKLGMLRDLPNEINLQAVLHLCAVLGFAFSCGLPAWAMVRMVFRYIDKMDAKGADITDAIKEVKEVL